MGTTLASAVIDRAAGLLQDKSFVRWTRAAHLEWLTDGQREAAVINPSLFVRSAEQVLVAGTRQTLPPDARALSDIPYNIDGAAITLVDRRALDSQVPDWHSASRAAKRVLHYCYAPEDPKRFLVFPPSPGGNSVEVIYFAIPPAIGAGSAISLDDSYTGALVDYLMYRAYAKDSEYSANGDIAALHRAAFIATVKGTGSIPPARAAA